MRGSTLHPQRQFSFLHVEQMEFLGSKINAGDNQADSSISYSPQDNTKDIETTDINEDPYKDFGDEFTLSSDDLPF